MKVIRSIADVEIGRDANKLLSGLFDEIYLVGGAVRDDILGRHTKDLDYCTPSSPDEIIVKLKSIGLYARTDAKIYGTVAFTLGVYDVQITSFRSESYTNESRHPEVHFIGNLNEDLARRDFTFNALAVSVNAFVDSYGGYDDLNRHIIRSVGNADIRFKEDPLRILRAYRFISQLGFDLHDETLNAVQSNVELLTSISNARIGSELNKILLGRYWTDALHEMITSNVLDYALSNEYFKSPISAETITDVLNNYTYVQLNDNDIVFRWAVFFSILVESKFNRDKQEKVLIKFISEMGMYFELGKKLTNEIITKFLALSINIDTRSSSEKRISRLQEELQGYIDNGSIDSRQQIVRSALDYELGRKEFKNHNFKAAQVLFEESIQFTDENFKITLKSAPEELMNFKAARYKLHFFVRYKYLIACKLMIAKLPQRINNMEYIIKEIRNSMDAKITFSFSDNDWGALVEEALILIYIKIGSHLSFGDFDEFLRKYTKYIAKEEVIKLRKNNLKHIAYSRNSSARQKVDAHRKLLELIDETLIDKNSEEYLSHELDYNIWYCMDTSNIKEFWERYDQLEIVACKVIELDAYDSTRKSYLASASVFIHALTLESSVNEKYDISLLVMVHYIMSRTNTGKRNAERFRIYRDWFKLMLLVGEVKKFTVDLPLLIQKLRTIKSLGYIDEDELYFTTELKDLASLRNKIKDVTAFINYVGGVVRDFENSDESSLIGISNLINDKVIAYEDAFKIFQNWCILQSYPDLSGISMKNIDQVYMSDNNVVEDNSENVILIEKGESESVEFKASFRYNIKAKMLDKTNDIPFGTIKTIAAFMNTKGGKIFIGVSDNVEITGLENSDFKVLPQTLSTPKKVDTVKLHIDEMINNLIGSHFSENVQIEWEQFNDKTFLSLSVLKSNSPVFCDGKFYIRTASSSRELKANEMLSYVKEHF